MKPNTITMAPTYFLTGENKMSYLSNNFDAFQEGIINGGYDPQEQDNHPVAGGDDWMFGWDAEPYEDNPYDGTYSEM